MRAGYDYNPALQNLQFFYFGANGFNGIQNIKAKKVFEPTFSCFNAMPVKSTKKITMDSAFGEICLISSS